MKSLRKPFSLILVAVLLLPPFGFQAEALEASPSSLENYALPKSLGKIEERFIGKTDRWVVQIQDIHAHLAAQENIAAIVDHLSAVYGIKTVGIEGGWTDTTFKESWGLPSSREKQMLARALLERAYLTGPAYAALSTPMPLHLIGIEDPKLYKENREAYLSYLNGKEALEKNLEVLEKKLQGLKQNLFGKELLAFDAALTAFREGQQAESFLPLVVTEAAKQNLPLGDLNQITTFAKILQMEKSLNKEKLQAEAGRLMKEFRKERLSFEELLKSGAVPEEKLTHYPASRAYLDLLREQDNISYRSFFAEIDTAVKRIKDKMFRTDEEKALDLRWENFLVAKQLLTLKSTPENLLNFERAKPEIEKEMTEGNLASSLNIALEFYRLARARDEVFANAMMNHAEFSKTNSILVAGGFHTAEVSKKLRDAGVSYLVITPDLQGEAPDENLYHERMKDPLPSAQTLAPPALFLSPAFDMSFPQAVIEVGAERNVLKGVQSIVSALHGASPAIVSEPSAVEGEDWNIETWRALTLEQKKQWLKDQLTLASSQGQERMYLVGTNDSFTNVLSNENTTALLISFLVGDRNNTIGLIAESAANIPTELVGTNSQLRRLRGTTLIEAADDIRRHFSEALANGRVAVLAGPNEEVLPNVLKLPLHPVALLYRLFLSSPQLRLAAQNQEFFDDLQKIFSQMENIEAFLRAA